MKMRWATCLLIAAMILSAGDPADSQVIDSSVTQITGGFGSDTRGGLDGRIVRVTNLKDAGEGSLRWALEDIKGPRLVVFEVSGQINMDHDITIRHPDVTVAGQTAPSPGITLTNASLAIRTHDVVLEHMRFRVGNLPGKKTLNNRDAIQMIGDEKASPDKPIKPIVYNVLIDHCSTSWSTDESISMYFPGVRDITIRNCILAEPLDHAGHSKGGHSMALLVGQHIHNITILGNLFAHSRYRNPVFKSDTNGIVANNIMYDIGNSALHTYGGYEGRPTLLTAVANVLLGSPTRARETHGKSKVVDFYCDKTTKHNWTNPGSKIYLSDNLLPPGSVEGRRLLDYDVFVSEPPVTLKGLRVMPPNRVVDYVLTHAGARPTDRDDVDQRIVREVRTGGGRIIDTQNDVGGWPKLAENHRELHPPHDHIEQWLQTFTDAVEQ